MDQELGVDIRGLYLRKGFASKGRENCLSKGTEHIRRTNITALQGTRQILDRPKNGIKDKGQRRSRRNASQFPLVVVSST